MVFAQTDKLHSYLNHPLILETDAQRDQPAARQPAAKSSPGSRITA
jgi:hypothetical protein